MPAVFPQPGPVGPAGPAETPFIYPVASPVTSVTIVHGLNRELVSVICFDATNTKVEGVHVQVVDDNTVELTTDLPFSGKVLII